MFAGVAEESAEASYFSTFLMEWSIDTDTIKHLDVQSWDLLINSFAVQDLGSNLYGVMITSN